MARGKHTEKKPRTFKNYLLAIISTLILCGLVYAYGAYTFNKNHFNPNVIINGVDVGRLTVNQATKKVNSAGYNTAVLRDGRVRTVHIGDSIKAINEQEISEDLRKQHTIFTSIKKWTFEPKSLEISSSKLNRLNDMRVTLSISNHDYELSPNDVFDSVRYYDGRYHYYDAYNADSRISELLDKSSTLNATYRITTPDNQQITVQNKSYGWNVDRDKLMHAIADAFNYGGGNVDATDYTAGPGYNRHGTGYGLGNHGLGKNYVLVSLKQQKMWVIKNGQPVVTLNDVVTGTEDTSKGRDNRTPTGVYYIMYKKTDTVLRGQNDDGSKYTSPVKYWMPFTEDGCGLHDASWRKDWSKNAYLEGGSHGCVNIRPDDIQSVWDNVYVNEPVIVYND